MNGHLEKFDKKNFDKFHKINAHIYNVAEEINRENSAGTYNNNALR